jgi:hypothetical protein
MDYTKELDLAEQHVRKGEEIVVRQRKRVARLKSKGQDARDAEILLETFKSSVALLDQHRRSLVEILHRLELPIHRPRAHSN